MTLFDIKIIALLTMVVDHLGVFVFPDNIYLRLVGRLSFPLFAWAIANGAYHTKNVYKYLLRLGLLGIISQVPYLLLFRAYGNKDPGLNILFTLSLGLVGIILIKKTSNYFVQIFIISLLLLFALLINTDYGIFGVLCVIFFYVYYNNRLKLAISYFILVTIFYLLPLFVNKLFGNIFGITYINLIELFSTLSLLIIFSYNEKIGYKLKYLFYVFYPVHLTIFYFMKLFLAL